jgi:hypothetical protein
LFVNHPVTVTISVQISPDPNLLANSVNLVRVNKQGQIIATLAPMYADGTHGDLVAGDGTFTAEVTPDASVPAEYDFAVTAAYKGALLRSKSQTAVLRVFQEPTDDQFQQVLDTVSAGSQYSSQQSAQEGDVTARNLLIAYLQQQPGVASAQLTPDGTTVGIIFTSGLTAVILAGPDDTKGGSGAAMWKGDKTP